MFSLPQVVSMSLVYAAKNGDVQACWMHAMLSIRPNPPISSIRSLHFISATTANQHNPPHSSPPSSKYPQAELVCPAIDCTLTLTLTDTHTHTDTHTLTLALAQAVRRLVAASLDMLCPNVVSLIVCMHASTQELQAWLDQGVGPDDKKDGVRIFAVEGSVSVYIRLVCIAALFALVSGCVVCRAGARCAGSGVTYITHTMHS